MEHSGTQLTHASFIDALIAIRKEVDEIVEGKFSKDNNVFKHAPHPMGLVLSDSWDRPYSREKAVYPVSALRKSKFWPSVSRVDDGESKFWTSARSWG